MINIISLGAGVQSSTMALMAAHGEIKPMPDAAIFADTGWEPKAVYEYLHDFLIPALPFPVYIATAGDLRQDTIDNKKYKGGKNKRFASIPWFTSGGGMGQRQCTYDYKITPLNWEVRRLLGVGRRERIPASAVSMWIGISTDEASRMKPTGVKWRVNRWPLIEQNMSRRDCLDWMAKHNYPEPAKSACIGCPFHSNADWRDMKMNDPASWADAVDIDKAIREGGTYVGMKAHQYMHRSCVPLDEVDFRNAEDMGQIDMFKNECEGMCGL